jgi:hypothetical protein
MFRYYDKGEECPAAKKLTFELRDKINYSCSLPLIYRIFKSLSSNAGKLLIEINILWKEEQALWLLKVNYVGLFITSEFQEINTLNSI